MQFLARLPLILALIMTSSLVLSSRAAQAEVAQDYPGVYPPVGPAAVEFVNDRQKAFNFGVAYAGQWAYYLIGQREIIEKDGSWHNWTTAWLAPHFDADRFEYNIFKHSITGEIYYQFYRSRGYRVEQAFMWSFFSSLAFEFSIETVTERPSFQDVYQTPVYGTILGIGLEHLSQACHSTNSFLGHACGYLLNPFTLIPASPKFAFVPDVSKDHVVANVMWEF